MLEGPAIRQGVEIGGATVLDLVPTILHLSGFPVAEDMDGNVLTEAFEPQWLADKPLIPRIDSYEGRLHEPARQEIEVPATVDEELLERLRALGYIN